MFVEWRNRTYHLPPATCSVKMSCFALPATMPAHSGIFQGKLLTSEQWAIQLAGECGQQWSPKGEDMDQLHHQQCLLILKG